MTKPLPESPGKELLMIMVEYPPGGVDPIHRHNAPALVYLLKGSIVMGAEGGQPVTLTPGQTFYEGPKTSIPSGVTRARRSRQSSSWCCSRIRTRRYSFP